MDDRFNFRAWDLKNKKMIYDIIPINDDYIITNIQGFHPDSMDLKIEKSNYIFMRCTGLKDVNDKLIYEGDIIIFIKNNCIIEVRNIKFSVNNIRIVKVIEETNQLGWDEAGYTFCKNNCNTIFKKIGNIYENPELLNKDK